MKIHNQFNELEENEYTYLYVKNYIAPYRETGQVVLNMVDCCSKSEFFSYSENTPLSDFYELQYKKLTQLVTELKEYETTSLKEDDENVSFFDFVGIMQYCLEIESLIKILFVMITFKLFRRK